MGAGDELTGGWGGGGEKIGNNVGERGDTHRDTLGRSALAKGYADATPSAGEYATRGENQMQVRGEGEESTTTNAILTTETNHIGVRPIQGPGRRHRPPKHGLIEQSRAAKLRPRQHHRNIKHVEGVFNRVVADATARTLKVLVMSARGVDRFTNVNERTGMAAVGIHNGSANMCSTPPRIERGTDGGRTPRRGHTDTKWG